MVRDEHARRTVGIFERAREVEGRVMGTADADRVGLAFRLAVGRPVGFGSDPQ